MKKFTQTLQYLAAATTVALGSIHGYKAAEDHRYVIAALLVLVAIGGIGLARITYNEGKEEAAW